MAFRSSALLLTRARPPRSSCDGASNRKPCPPCVPHPRPPCRGRRPPPLMGLKVICCPPPHRNRPPCPPPLPACALNCDHRLPPLKNNSQDCTLKSESCSRAAECSSGRDTVTRRLAAAKAYRREQYEAEACSPAAPVAPPVADGYRLPPPRECATATDGQQYTFQPQPDCPPPCGPHREPPPPRLINLDRPQDNACRPEGMKYVDPCAHEPRIIVERAPQLRPAPRPEPTPPPEPRPLAKARHAGHSGWCKELGAPPAASQPCEPPSLMERLKRRAQQQCPPGSRSLHTLAVSLRGAERDLLYAAAARTHSTPQFSYTAPAAGHAARRVTRVSRRSCPSPTAKSSHTWVSLLRSWLAKLSAICGKKPGPCERTEAPCGPPKKDKPPSKTSPCQPCPPKPEMEPPKTKMPPRRPSPCAPKKSSKSPCN